MLDREKCKYFRVKRGQSASELERELCVPVPPSVCAGAILCLEKYKVVCVQVGDDYEKIAERAGVDVETLKNVNFGAPLYPTKKIFVPELPALQ